MQTPFHPAMYMYQSLPPPWPLSRQLIPNLCCDMSFMEPHCACLLYFHLLLALFFWRSLFQVSHFAFHAFHPFGAVRTHMQHKSIFLQCKFSHGQILNNVQAFLSGVVSSEPQFLFSLLRKWHCTSKALPPLLI
ncbi:hypothetical protein V8C35DRAFT_33566 [Trichoderma chlorosporum]